MIIWKKKKLKGLKINRSDCCKSKYSFPLYVFPIKDGTFNEYGKRTSLNFFLFFFPSLKMKATVIFV